MKREGRQHGTVRISRSKVLKTTADADADAESAAAVAFALAATEKKAAAGKPTNASRSTGKCRRPRCAGCHAHPVTKARDKAKGAHKLRACDVALNHRLVSWRVVDDQGSGVPEYRGKSASSLLAYLAGGSGNSWHEDDDDTSEGGIGAPEAGLSDLYDLFVGRRADAEAEADPDPAARDTDLDDVGEIQAIGEPGLLLDGDDGKEDGDEKEEEDMGFCMVGITIAVEFSDGEEDWIVVEEV
ncbi:uncharacterized protein LOC8063832 [Sorghum bicolor]|jgi:hypothetical protein|uniref:Uncharacterized protein n=1 Tax=Sorghum bicolor TaxID=4558 RepID=C5Z966_SORBI|nr:uncharacterized protein LOC8063832 [Sorghum bicolor]EER90325.1 hypothetical protein SORBI_3010G251400 [Sorghum bicolor]|eukprot:XP_002438958.1 uncharacterized protein LOC8063832 [Sorghum bicolor]